MSIGTFQAVYVSPRGSLSQGRKLAQSIKQPIMAGTSVYMSFLGRVCCWWCSDLDMVFSFLHNPKFPLHILLADARIANYLLILQTFRPTSTTRSQKSLYDNGWATCPTGKEQQCLQ